MRHVTTALTVLVTLSACADLPTTPDPEVTLPVFGLTVVPAGSSVQLTANANAASNSSSDPATVTSTDNDAQISSTGPLSASVNAVSVNGAGFLQVSGGISATWTGADAGQVVWDVAWEAANLPASTGSLVGVAAIGTGDGWTYTFTADMDGNFVVDFGIPVGGSNTFGLNPFNFLWHLPGTVLPQQTLMAQGTNGTVTKPVLAGSEYTVRITNNSGLTTTGNAMSDRTANMTGTFDWRIAPSVMQVEIDIKPGSDPNCINNDGHGVIPVAILGSAGFDVTAIEPATVQLESLAVRAVGKKGGLQAHIEDVNGDGFDDLVVHIEDTDGAFTNGSGTATLTGALLDGTPFEGTDTICIVPPQ